MTPVPAPRVRDEDDLHVIVPGLMGAGILLSAGILVVDGVRRILPSGDEARRAFVGAASAGVLSLAAEAAGDGRGITRAPHRALWTRRAYLAAALVLGLGAALTLRLGINVWQSDGLLAGNPWPFWGGIFVGAVLSAGALFALALAAAHDRLPMRWRQAVASTPLGKVRAPEGIERRIAAMWRAGGAG